MYEPNQIANYFLHKYPDDPNMTPMKLIKLVYIAHGWHLGLDKGPLINEAPQAWKYGPVIPSLYYRFKKYKDSKIDENPSEFPQDEELTSFIDELWDVYGKYDGIQLGAKTHQVGTPWYIVWNGIANNPFKFNLEIPNDLIKSHYRKLAA